MRTWSNKVILPWWKTECQWFWNRRSEANHHGDAVNGRSQNSSRASHNLSGGDLLGWNLARASSGELLLTISTTLLLGVNRLNSQYELNCCNQPHSTPPLTPPNCKLTGINAPQSIIVQPLLTFLGFFLHLLLRLVWAFRWYWWRFITHLNGK